MRLVDSSPTWPHPNPDLASICSSVEGMITSLRQSLASPNDDGAEDDGEGATAAKGLPRLSLAVVAQCDLLSAEVRCLSRVPSLQTVCMPSATYAP